MFVKRDWLDCSLDGPGLNQDCTEGRPGSRGRRACAKIFPKARRYIHLLAMHTITTSLE